MNCSVLAGIIKLKNGARVGGVSEEVEPMTGDIADIRRRDGSAFGRQLKGFKDQ